MIDQSDKWKPISWTKMFGGALCVAIVVLIGLMAIQPKSAEAHVVTPKICADAALAQAREVPPATVAEWRIYFNRCQAYAKKHNLHHICTGVIGIHPATVKGQRATKAQQRNIARSIRVGYKMRMTTKEIISMVMAITVESRAYNLTYGHSSSVGILQLLNIHGSYQWRMVIENSVGWYFRGVKTLNTYNMTPGQIAGRVQRPADRSVYSRYQGESTRTVKTYLGPMIVCLRPR